MNIPSYKTIKIGRLLISRINNEITFLYKGKKKIYSRSVYRDSFSLKSLKLVLIFLFAGLIGFSFYSIKTNISKNSNQSVQVSDENEESDQAGIENNNDGIDQDEKVKNELLLSAKTDYTEAQNESLQIREYAVQKGDSLSEIAKEYGVSMDTICGSNNLFSYDIIQTGKVLKIPNKDGILHKVNKGDTVIRIAEKYNVTVEKIFSENQKKNFDFISLDDLIFVPDAKPQNIIPGFLWPVLSRRITSRFGMRRHPVYKTRMFHSGLDIRCNYQSVRAAKFGRVAYTGYMGRYGKTIIIAHPGGWKSLYGHLSEYYVKPGQSVKQGQPIAKSGDTGVSTGPHLHFELRQYGGYKNPLKYLH
jgi:murein DD-endopeptidase MepM/ murein hydrolase activator NlpD